MTKTFFHLLGFAGRLIQLKIQGLAPLKPLHGGVLDEQTRILRKGQKLLGEQPLDELSPQQARANFHNNFPLLKSIGGLFEKVDETTDVRIPGPAGEILARLYRCDPKKVQPLFVFIHGGGWVIGDLDSGDNMARFICKHAGCVVLSIDYRLAPEHPFPAAVDDCLAAVAWASTHAVELGSDSRRLLVGGDSAGGNLAAVVSQMAHQKGSPTITGQVLLYAAMDGAHLDTPSYKAFGDTAYGLPTADMLWFLEQYTPNSKDRLNPLVSPLLAKHLEGLPPALVVTAEFDVLQDEGEMYARRLEKAGVPVKLMRCNGTIHGFLSTLGLIQRANKYFELICEEIKRMEG
jgi:acetyl esterase